MGPVDCFGHATDINVSVTQLFAEELEQTLKDNGGATKTHALIDGAFEWRPSPTRSR